MEDLRFNSGKMSMRPLQANAARRYVRVDENDGIIGGLVGLASIVR